MSSRGRAFRSPVLLAFVAILVFHGCALLAILLATRGPRVTDGASAAGADRSPAAASAIVPWAAEGAPPDRPTDARAAPPAEPAEILSAPEVIQTEPVVPLPPDREGRSAAIEDVRQRRVARMLEEQAARALRR